MNGKVLVIDDEKSLRFTFNTFLKDAGYEVQTAEDYDSAMKIITRNTPDIIFADIVLGDCTGIDILREVKAKGMQCPVVMITGEPNIETAAESVRLGAFDYVPKPVEEMPLLHIAHLAFQHKGLLDEKMKLAEENDRYRRHHEAIFRSVQDGILTVDTQLRIIETNDSIKNNFFAEFQDIVGKNLRDMNGEFQNIFCLVLDTTLKEKKNITEYRADGVPDKNGQKRTIVLNSSPLQNTKNEFIGAVLVVRDITRLSNLERELSERGSFQKLIGKSTKMQELYGLLETLAEIETTLLVIGESGTGKELVADALHYNGKRASKPFVKVNCSALSENLLESELFGHVAGAFTGATKNKKGRFQLADGGTLFLDEIGDISPRIQMKLLRVLQEKEFEMVGDTATLKVDVRVIAVTNRDLKEKVRSGEFREDLYYRLKVIEILIPPLRDRREDIPLLVKHFCTVFTEKFQKYIEGVSDEVLEILMNYSWPGNIRELEHAMEHAFALCRGGIITSKHLPLELQDNSRYDMFPLFNKKSYANETILKALEKTRGNKAKAARLLGISRRTIHRKIKGEDSQLY